MRLWTRLGSNTGPCAVQRWSKRRAASGIAFFLRDELGWSAPLPGALNPTLQVPFPL